MIQNFLNEVSFHIRQKYLGKFILRNGLPQVSLGKESILKENQYYKMILSEGFHRANLPEVQQVIDVGCRNWSYISALSEFFPSALLKGIEVDGGRRYWNLYRRIDQTRAYGQALKRKENREVYWVHGDFRETKRIQADLPVAFCFFFPFVSYNPCLKWGLPARFACFKELLRHSKYLAQKAKSPAVWISSHQGEWEADIAREVYAKAGLQWEEYILPVESFKHLWPSRYETRIFVAKEKQTT